jgi:hypothetical protein
LAAPATTRRSRPWRLDTKGDTLWLVALPETSLIFPWVTFDDSLSTAALVMADFTTDDDPEFRPYVLVCRSPGKTERLESSALGLPPEATVQEVSVSPDGRMLAIKSYGFPGYDGAVSLCSLKPEIELRWTVQSDCERPLFSENGRMLVCPYGGGSIRQVQVLSTTDGGTLWEKTDQMLGGDDLNESTGSSMWDSAPAFLWHSLSDPRSVLLVDLSGAEPEVKALSQEVGPSMAFPGRNVIFGISEDGQVTTTPRP